MSDSVVPLPESLVVTRNRSAEAELLTAARVWMESDHRDPAAIHVSDLLAPRLAYWRRVQPLPLSDRLVPVFLIGRILHAFVTSFVDHVPLDVQRSDGGPRSDPELGVVFSPDLVHRGVIRELKTTRSFYAPTHHDDIGNYLGQLVCYMAAMKHTVSQLWILFLNLRGVDNKTRPEFRAFTIEATQEDLALVREWMVATRLAIQTAIRDTQHSVLPLCPEFMCGTRNCEWFEACQPEGRWKRGG